MKAGALQEQRLQWGLRQRPCWPQPLIVGTALPTPALQQDQSQARCKPWARQLLKRWAELSPQQMLQGEAVAAVPKQWWASRDVPGCLLLTFLFFLLLLLLLGAGVMAQDICSSPGHGDLPAPEFQMTPTAAEEGEQVLVWCIIGWKSPNTQIIFCKDGVQVHSLKAQQGKGSYYMLLTMTLGSAGTFTCGYQHKDNSGRVRNSALSAPKNLSLKGAGVMAQDICSSPEHGDLEAPALFVKSNTTFSAAQEGELVLFRCQIQPKSSATRIIFCKDGVQVHSLKAQQGRWTYYMLLTVTTGSAGTFTCGYQHKDKSNQVRNSAFSAPLNLSVTGSGSSSQAGTSSNGTCRERCQRKQQVSTHEAEVTEDNEIQYSTITHTGCNGPRRQELNSSTEYAPVRLSHSQPR